MKTAAATSEDIFQTQAHTWWDEEGPFKPLHQMNPTRLSFIVSNVCKHLKTDSIKGLRILDVGCGGGLLSEPLSRLGAKVVGIDLSKEAIDIAQKHAASHALDIDYRVANLKDLENEKFDVVVASEVIEHVDDYGDFMRDIANLLDANGCTVITTLNRTWKSLLLGIYVAENVLKWAPRGTHQHEKFLKPSELRHAMDQAGINLTKLQGLSFNPFEWKWELSGDMDINYFAFGVKG